ncbi:Heat shock transcription factor [Saxophila tyrrhenica]|uniref:Heat shock transcription factor n=1 Tax=Saxophila tyrrhenica TaxID=1690608 RepID=A0AAV9P107_9PEZI|nr:Heat shock transcription factor [Saxophila tyrrhenica]
MQNSPQNRKRPAPGTSPMPQQPQQSNFQYPQIPDNADFSNFDFSNPLPDQTFANTTFDDNNNLNSYGLNSAQRQTYGSNFTPAAPSTELVRRTRNQQLAPQNGQQQEQWNGSGGLAGSPDTDDDMELERRADAAMKEGLAKRKSIPPFIQKLSSFLDSNHTDLIRWSDDGKSFIVLDEDEFARTLIPELFKHNNYASFVRQLNMYGFHKTINITDGSLRQSEKARKGLKPPSMYSHRFFQRNRPKLLWLINKPGGKSTAKRKRDGTIKEQYDSDDERQYSPVPESRIQELGAPSNTLDLAQLPRNEIAAVRSELQKLQSQQKFISQMITQLKDQNDQFYRQASAFQALHDRHENSINAILTFLATFYNRSVEGQGAQNLVNMFTNAAAHQNQQHGSVVEEYTDGTPDPQASSQQQQLQRYMKRPQLLLPGPNSANANQSLQPGNVATEPNSARASASPPNDGSNGGSVSSGQPQPQSTTTAPSPNVKAESQTPNEEMMSLINTVNATTQASTPNSTTAPDYGDFKSIVDHYQNLTGNPLTPQQRENTLQAIMSSQGGANAGDNNALTHPAPPNFDLQHLRDQDNTIEQLQVLQKQNQDSLKELGRRLSPHSPTGNIPGLVQDIGQDPFDLTGAPGDYDPNAFINFDENTWDGGGDGDFDFGFDTGAGDGDNNNWPGNMGAGAGGENAVDDLFGPTPADPNHLAAGQNGGQVESVSSSATSPAGPNGGEDGAGTPNKRQRRS